MRKASRTRRIFAFATDHFIFCFLGVALVFILGLEEPFENIDPEKFFMVGVFVMFPLIILYICKDFIRGISAGKWVFGIMVRDADDSQKVPENYRLFLRNLFIIIWPIEFIVLALNPEKRRIGDMKAKTDVLTNPDKAKRSSRILVLVSILVLFFSFTFLITANTLKNSEAYKVATQYIESSPELKARIGEITGYGTFPSGNMSVSGISGSAQFRITVKGESDTEEVSITLEKDQFYGTWRVLKMEVIN
jgi:uncharacterized RDD family membrane protein YckC